MERTRSRRAVEFDLPAFHSILPGREFAQVARLTGCTPRRRRRLVPEVVCWLMMYVALTTTSMTRGLAGAWTILGLRRTRCPAITEEAFCQARAGLPLRFFRLLLRRLAGRYTERFDAAMRWKGLFRVLAADGSIVTLAKNATLALYFGTASNDRGACVYPQARLTALCSVFTGYCLGFLFTPLRFAEQVAVRHLLRSIRPMDLVLMDRNFFSFAIIMMILRHGGHALIRVRTCQARGFQRVRRLAANDRLVELRPQWAARRRHGLPERLTMRLIRYQVHGFRPSWLLTTLTDPCAATADELVELYHRRWSIETIYREWKHTLNIQNIRSATPRGVRKEICAQILLHNLVRWVMTEAAEGTGLAPVQLSFTAGVTYVNAFIVAMIGQNTDTITRGYRRLLGRVRATRIRHRPGRSYPRAFDRRPRPKGHGVVQRPNRIIRHA